LPKYRSACNQKKLYQIRYTGYAVASSRVVLKRHILYKLMLGVIHVLWSVRIKKILIKKIKQLMLVEVFPKVIFFKIRSEKTLINLHSSLVYPVFPF